MKTEIYFPGLTSRLWFKVCEHIHRNSLFYLVGGGVLFHVLFAVVGYCIKNTLV